MKTNNMINRAKNTTVGKVLCRLVGEEAGQTMMEYVIIAVLVAAACAAGIAYFGRSNARGIKTATDAVSTNVKEAADDVKEQQEKGGKDAAAAVTEAEKFSTAPHN